MTLLWIILLPLFGLVLPLLAARQSRTAASLAAFVPPAISLGLLLNLAPAAFSADPMIVRWPWMPEFGMNLALRLDGLGFLFAFLILAIGLLVVTYAHFYLHADDPPGRFFGSLLLFMGAMLGVVLSENILLLVVFWELTSISSFLLIGYWHERPIAREGARMALAITGSGGLALIGGALLLGHMVGSYQLTEILASGELIRNHELYLPALILVLLGAFTKSAQFPFHFWLPNAMTAPTPVSAYLHSATMVKAGIFLMARLHPAMAGTPAWTWIVSTVGLTTMVVGAYIAIKKHDLKGLLAYSTISHLGLITAMLGFGVKLAVLGAIFHVFNHAAFKASLFMTAGIVDHEAGTRDMRELGGLRSKMPIVFVLGLLGAAAMAGVPFFNGFLSKEMFFHEAVYMVDHAPFAQAAGAWLLPVAATIGGIFSVAYSIRFVVDTFFGEEPESFPGHPHDPSPGFWLPVAVLVAVSVVGGLFPNVVAGTIVEYASATGISGVSNLEALPKKYHGIKLWHGFNLPLGMSAIAFVAGFGIFAVRRQIVSFHEHLPDVTGKRTFEIGLSAFLQASREITVRFENGSLQRYVALLIATILVAGGLPLWANGFRFGTRELVPIDALSIIGWMLLIVGAIAAAWLHRRRIQALVSVGLVGLMISLTFVQFSGPDLAMTQLSVEVVNVMLLLLALFGLPEESPLETTSWQRLRDVVLAVVAGAGAALVAYGVMTRDLASMSDYFLAYSYPKGHGTNVVNVILVDFRGFDTMGEISVLAIAALGLCSLLTGDKPEIPRPRPPSRERYPMILSHVARPLMALVLAAAIYIFLRGHNQPGGGFIAGLVTTVALIIQYVAHGRDWADNRMRMNFRLIALAGVLIAVCSGMASWLFSVPFLTHGITKLPVPAIEYVKLTSTLAFDLGVYLAVVGSVMTMLLRLGAFNHEDAVEPRDPMTPNENEEDPWRP
jgi:multicomponent K+:H+ antiporter subunit A